MFWSKDFRFVVAIVNVSLGFISTNLAFQIASLPRLSCSYSWTAKKMSKQKPMHEKSCTSSASLHELSTVVSYALLYQSLDMSDLAITAMDELQKCNQNKCYWQDDEWTLQDTIQAEALLKNNESKCSIPKAKLDFYKIRANQSWDRFYQCHGTNFFNDRHYLSKAFPHEFGVIGTQNQKCLVEIGCGVGNNILPLIKCYPHWKIWGYDVSKVAIDLMMHRLTGFDSSCVHVGVWDIASPGPAPIREVADICTLLFTLSAIAPESMKLAIDNVVTTLRPGGVVVLRDYGKLDEAQLKLGIQRAKRLGENFYVKHDGTRCYYFSLSDLESLFALHAGLEVLELKLIRRVYHNRAKDEQRRRVWVQGRFRKPEWDCARKDASLFRRSCKLQKVFQTLVFWTKCNLQLGHITGSLSDS